MKWSTIVLSFLSLIVLNSCENDLDVTSGYKDTTIVYGMLNPNDSIQYLKIYKAFMGEGNAYDYAHIADSIYFDDVLNVTLYKVEDGISKDSLIFLRDTLSPMLNGVFALQPNITYTSSKKIQSGSTYILRVINSKNGSVVTSKTGVPGNSSLSEPNPFKNEISLASSTGYQINWLSGLNSKIYNVVMKFNYQLVCGTDTSDQYVEWLMGTKTVKESFTRQYLDIQKTKDAFYQNLNAKLSAPDSGCYRIAGKIELIIIGAADDYYYYQKINNATVGISQSIPSYNNITNGLGLFSAKTTNSWYFDLDPMSYDYLIHGPYTSHLKFY